MIDDIEAFMTADHAQLDDLLKRADRADGTIDMTLYERFRSGLLRHIAMEEKVLIPFLREHFGGGPLPIATALRRDHGEIAKLLVPTPDAALLDRLRQVLALHNALEEGPDGLYAKCDTFAGDARHRLMTRLRAQPEVPVAKHYDGPLLHLDRERARSS